MRIGLLAVLSVGVSVGWSSVGYACGATEELLEPLLPHPDQVGVPTNAVLWATANSRSPTIQLRRIGSVADAPAPADAGEVLFPEPTAVEVETTCLPEYDQLLCFARAELAPNTEYEWQVGAQHSGSLSPWQAFTTGTHEAERAAAEVEVSVVQNDLVQGGVCSSDAQVVQLEFRASDLERPVVVAGSSMQLSYPYGRAWVLDPGAASTTVHYLPLQACSEVVAFDILGLEHQVRKVCFDEELEQSFVMPDGSRVPLSERPSTEPAAVDAPSEMTAPDQMAEPMATEPDSATTEVDSAVDSQEEVPAPSESDAQDDAVIGRNPVDPKSSSGCSVSTRRTQAAWPLALLLGVAVTARRKRGQRWSRAAHASRDLTS